MRFLRAVAVAASLGLVLSGLSLVTAPTVAQAATGSQFDPGNIISDSYFYDGGAMSANQVQSFLNSQVTNCRAGYTCVKDYTQQTRSIPAVSGRCAAYDSQGVESAAMIIAKVGAACNISQKALLVTLQKEQTLITHTWPSEFRFTIAMGYGCPDTAPCNTEYYGFQNQVYRAALQFQTYLHYPNSFNHKAFRVNTVRYHPNAACGSSQVYIQNNATAGLYNYTPYQPNAAALTNLYGTGDGCSSYGNRNFWRIYTDWFGSTTTSSLVRTASNATVYLTAGDRKYTVPSIELLSIFSVLGPVNYVSQSYLDSFPTVGTASRNIRSSDGSIYFTDASIKLAFTSCAQLEDFGGSCAPNGYVQLTDGQIAAFHTGPTMTNVLATGEGNRYYISAGQKREVLDRQSLTLAGIPTNEVVLTERAVSHLTLGSPLVRDSVYVKIKGSNAMAYLGAGLRHHISDSDATTLAAAARASGTLTAASVERIALAPGPFTGVVTSPSGAKVVLDSAGRYSTPEGSPFFAIPGSVQVSEEFLASYPDRGSLVAGTFFKTASSTTVYITMPSNVRPIASWDALLALSSSSAPAIVTITSGAMTSLPTGPFALTAGSLYRTPENTTVYLINGVTSRIPFSSFDYPTAAGFTKFAYTSADRLEGYSLDSTLLTYGLICGGSKYLTSAGQVHKIQAAEESLYPITFVSLDAFTCANLRFGPDATNLIRVKSGKIYQLVAGEKRQVETMQRLAEIDGGRAWVQVDEGLASMIPTGPLA